MPANKLLLSLILCLSLAACGGDTNDPATNTTTNTGGVTGDSAGNPATGTGNETGGQSGGQGSGPNNGESGGQTGTDPDVDPSGQTGGTATPADGFGQDGITAYRLRGFGSAFNLMEGTGINVPVDIQRVNGHQRDVTLSVRQDPTDPDGRLGFQLDQQQLAADQGSVNLNIVYLYGAKRATPRQFQLIITASDGLAQSETTLVLNIQSTDKPDIYLLAGQSNMVGFSEDFAKDISAGGSDERNERIMQLNVTANDTNAFTGVASFATQENQVGFPDFSLAEDPLHTSRDPNLPSKIGTRVGLGLSFAKRALTSDPNHKIILVPAAWSATGFCDTGDFLAQGTNVPQWIVDGELGWSPFQLDDPAFGGTTLFTRAVVRTNMAIERSGGILRGILWHQGESDADNSTCAASYQPNLQLMVSELRSQIMVDARGELARGDSSDVPFIAGTLSRGRNDTSDFSAFSNDRQLVDNILRNVGDQNLIPFSGAALFDDLIPSNGFPCGEGSCVHFGAAAYREIGSRYFDVLQSILSTLP